MIYTLNPPNYQKEVWLFKYGATTKPEMIDFDELINTGYLPVCFIKNSMNLETMNNAIIIHNRDILDTCIHRYSEAEDVLWFTIPVQSLIQIGAVPKP